MGGLGQTEGVLAPSMRGTGVHSLARAECGQEQVTLSQSAHPGITGEEEASSTSALRKASQQRAVSIDRSNSAEREACQVHGAIPTAWACWPICLSCTHVSQSQ